MNAISTKHLADAANAILAGETVDSLTCDLDQSPQSWLLKAWASESSEQTLEALSRVLELDPQNQLAQTGKDWVEGLTSLAREISLSASEAPAAEDADCVEDDDTTETSSQSCDSDSEIASSELSEVENVECELEVGNSTFELFGQSLAFTKDAAVSEDASDVVAEDVDEVVAEEADEIVAEDTEEAEEVFYWAGETVESESPESSDSSESEALEDDEAELNRLLEEEAEATRVAEEAEAKRLEEEAAEADAEAQRREEEEADRLAQEAEAQRVAEEEAKQAEAEAQRLVEEAEAQRAAEEAEARRVAEEEAEANRLAEEAEANRLAEEAEAQRVAEEEAEANRLAEEAEAQRVAEEEAEANRLAEEAEAQRVAEEEAEAEANRLADEAEAQPVAEEETSQAGRLTVESAAAAVEGLRAEAAQQQQPVAEETAVVADAETVEAEIQENITELSTDAREVLAEVVADKDETSGSDSNSTSDKKPVVLAVDDSPTIRKLVSMTLSREGFEVITAADGLEALQILSEQIPDIILSDVNMPRLDGYKLCRFVKKHDRTKHIPVVMLSGKDGVFDKLRGKMFGCGDYITKPFESADLIEKVRLHTGVLTS